MTQIKIRPFSENDVAGFHACLDAVARERKYLGFVAAPPIEETRQRLLEDLEQDQIRLVAIDGSHLVGWCDIETHAREGFTHSGRLGMGVLKAYRGQGIGRALLEQTLAAARARNLERVELEVYASNLAAIGLYAKFNFQAEGRRRKARKIDNAYDDVILMARFVDSAADQVLG